MIAYHCKTQSEFFDLLEKGKIYRTSNSMKRPQNLSALNLLHSEGIVLPKQSPLIDFFGVVIVRCEITESICVKNCGRDSKYEAVFNSRLLVSLILDLWLKSHTSISPLIYFAFSSSNVSCNYKGIRFSIP